MNIFFLDNDPVIAAQMQCNTHCVKMILESAQMLSTAHRVLDGKLYLDNSSGRKIKRWQLPDTRESVLYKATHVNHPSNIWTRETLQNYMWHYDHFCALCDEYTYRYSKIHATDTKLRKILAKAPSNIQETGPTPIELAMPEKFYSNDRVTAYRNYYRSKQDNFNMVWTKRNVPKWFTSVSI